MPYNPQTWVDLDPDFPVSAARMAHIEAGIAGEEARAEGVEAGLATSIAAVTATGAAGGDLSGTYPNPTVAKVHGVAAAAVTTKGDLLATNATPALARLPVGSDTQVLTADSTQATGMKWAAAAVGSLPFTVAPLVQDGSYGHLTVGSGVTTSAGGTFTAGWTTPTVGQSILIAGAGVAGADLLTTITGWNGSIITWTTATSTAVTSAPTHYGTDNTAALQTAVNAVSTLRGGEVWITNPSDAYYFFASTVNMPRFGVRLLGVGGGGDNLPTLVYMGATGSLLNYVSPEGGQLEGLTLAYSNQAYSGDLVVHEGSSGDCQNNYIALCSFIPLGTVTNQQTANSFVRLNKEIFGGIDACSFYGAQKNIQVGGGNYVNVYTISRCSFSHALIGEIYIEAPDCESLTISGNGFEPLAYGAAGGVVGAPNSTVWGLNVTGNWGGDIGGAGGEFIGGVYAAVNGAKVDGNMFAGPGPAGGAVQTLTQTGSASSVWTLKYTDAIDSTGQTATAIAANATAAQVQTALRTLTDIGTNVTCTGGPLGTSPVVCTFAAPNAYHAINLLVATNPTGATIAVTGVGGAHFNVGGGNWLIAGNYFLDGYLFDLTALPSGQPEGPIVTFVGNTIGLAGLYSNGTIGSFNQWEAFGNFNVFSTPAVPDTISATPTGAAGGDLSGTYPNPGVAKLNGVAAASYATLTGTQTLTNKRVTPRVVTVTQAAAPAINTDNMDVASITALAQAITSMTTNLTGTPVDGDGLLIRITDNGTARAITWGASFEASTIALPITTVVSAMLCVEFVWNTVTSKWRCVGVA